MKFVWYFSVNNILFGIIFKRLSPQNGVGIELFDSFEEMNEFMIDRHNAVVRPNDKVYFGGDVAMNPNFVNLVARMNGHKRLIIGNHDKLTRNSPLVRVFDKIMMWWPFEEFIFSHVPLREDQMTMRTGNKFNVHGHIHQNDSPTKNHINVSVEKINFTPISLEQLRENKKALVP